MNEKLQKARRAQEAGNPGEAARLYGEVLRGDSRNVEALLALGFLHFRSARFADAERLCAEAARLNPRLADAFFIRGCALQRLERGDEALACFEQAIAARPGFVEALVNRGALLMTAKRRGEALQSFDQALAINPGMLEAWNNRGNVLSELGRHADAVASYDKVLAARPQAFEAWINRGTALSALRRHDEALASYGQAARLNPDAADALAGRGNALFELKDYEQAAIAYEVALARNPDCANVRGNLAFAKLHCCDWRSLDADRKTIARELRQGRRMANPFQATALLTSPDDLLHCATLWSADKHPPAAAPLWQGERYAHRDKIRVAYLSADFNGHAVATLLAGVLDLHDKLRFETTAISFVGDDGGAMRKRLACAFDRVIDVAGMTDAEVATLMRRDEVDIAVDLMGCTGECRPGIFALRPCPVQVNFLGYPGTMGADYFDFIIADSVVIPEEQRRHYRERVVYLPDTYLPTDATRPIDDLGLTRTDAGLPESGFVFCSFNNSFKFSPETFDVWMRLLRASDASVLWLPKANGAAMRNLCREAEARGVPASRLVFAPFVDSPSAHLARLSLADLFLDTLPYNAHSTAVDALWAGVPVLTARGSAFAGRVGASLLKAVGLPDMIAESLADYESLALRLARDPEALADVKARLRGNRSTCALFDTARFTRNLEAAYRAMWEQGRA